LAHGAVRTTTDSAGAQIHWQVNANDTSVCLAFATAAGGGLYTLQGAEVDATEVYTEATKNPS
jgi:hypothetical protein